MLPDGSPGGRVMRHANMHDMYMTGTKPRVKPNSLFRLVQKSPPQYPSALSWNTTSNAADVAYVSPFSPAATSAPSSPTSGAWSPARTDTHCHSAAHGVSAHAAPHGESAGQGIAAPTGDDDGSSSSP